ncbi:unnamed protein product [Merluccius merluccius]
MLGISAVLQRSEVRGQVLSCYRCAQAPGQLVSLVSGGTPGCGLSAGPDGWQQNPGEDSDVLNLGGLAKTFRA